MKKSKKFLAVLALCATCGVAATGCSLSGANSEEVTKVIDNATDRISSILEKQISEINEEEARIILANAVTNSALQSKIHVDISSTYFEDNSFHENLTVEIHQTKITEDNGNVKALTKAKLFIEDELQNYTNNKLEGQYKNFEIYNVTIEDKSYTFDAINRTYSEGYYSLELGPIAYEISTIYDEKVSVIGTRKDDITTIYVSNISEKEFTTITIKENLIISIETTMARTENNEDFFAGSYDDSLKIQKYKYGNDVTVPSFPTSLNGYTKGN